MTEHSRQDSHFKSGFTLLEIMVVVALLSVLLLTVGTVWLNAFSVWEVQDDFALTNAALRDSSSTIADEVRLSTRFDLPSALPPVIGLTVEGDPPTSVTFQKPLTPDGLQWTVPITFRLYNEDVNGDLRLDASEDLNQNGLLDRVIERLEDKDGNGVYDAPGEARIVARGIDNLVFTLNGDKLDMIITARRKSDRRNVLQEHSFNSSITLINSLPFN